MFQGTQPPRIDRDALSEDDPGAPLTRVGTVVGGGVCAAIVASVPASIRIGDGGSSSRALDQWLALAALALPVGILCVGVLRRARAGLRVLAGDRATVLVACTVWWAVLQVGVLSVLGAILRAKTHHHGLAGVTFAMAALVTGLLSALLAVRGGHLLARAPETAQRAVLYAAAAAAFLVVMLVGVRTARAEGLHTAAALVDVLAIVVSAAIASAKPFTRARALAYVGVPVAAIVLVAGLATLRSQPPLQASITENAPVHASILGIFAH